MPGGRRGVKTTKKGGHFAEEIQETRLPNPSKKEQNEGFGLCWGGGTQRAQPYTIERGFAKQHKRPGVRDSGWAEKENLARRGDPLSSERNTVLFLEIRKAERASKDGGGATWFVETLQEGRVRVWPHEDKKGPFGSCSKGSGYRS